MKSKNHFDMKAKNHFDMQIQLAEKIDNVCLSGLYFAQAKIDGIRAIATRVNGHLSIFTRQGNEITVCSHIKAELEQIVEEGCTMDGELFYKSFSDTLKDFKNEGENLTFIVFDYYNEETKLNKYSSRIKALKRIIENCRFIKFVPMLDKKIKSVDVDNALDYFINAGYEGLILRKDVMFYSGRTENLIKVKRFQDDEFIVQDVLKTEKSYRVQFLTHEGKTFFTKGTADFWKYRKRKIGKKATVRFQEYSTKGIPRFPILVTSRDYE